MTPQEKPRSTKVGRPTRQNKDAAEDRIIAAATELFSTKGFAGTSMEQVAAQCGAGKDTVYRRFPSKVALFEAVVMSAHGRAIERIAQLPELQGDALERLRGLLFELLAINMEPDLIALKRISFSEAVIFGKSAPLTPQPDPLMLRLIDAVKASLDAGMIEGGDPDRIASHLIHCLVALPTSAAMLGNDTYGTEEAIRQHFEQTWKWLIDGLR